MWMEKSELFDMKMGGTLEMLTKTYLREQFGLENFQLRFKQGFKQNLRTLKIFQKTQKQRYATTE